MWDRVRGTALYDDACGSARKSSCRRSSASTYGNADVSQAFLLCGHAGYLHLITAGREATDRGVFGRKFKWLELVARVKK